MNEVKRITTDNDTVITAENVKVLGELIGVKALMIVKPYSGKVLDVLYVGLVRDMHRAEDSPVPFSDGYDVAATAICFLCEHMGKMLGDLILDRYGNLVSIISVCYKKVYAYLDQCRYYKYNTISFGELTRRNEPYTETEEWAVEDYTAYDAIIDKMKPTPALKETLDYFMTDLNYTDIARRLGINRTTVYRRLWQLQRIYNAKVATVTN